MRTRISIPILLVVIFQLLTFVAVLIFGGEFRNLREYAYDTLVEKTQSRSIYIEGELEEKPAVVREYAQQIDSLVAGLLARQGAGVADLRTDEELSHAVMESCVDAVVGLMRRAVANDAYLILDTGELYAQEGGGEAKVALYLRDLDVRTDGGYEDLLMTIGFTSIAQERGISRHSGWSAYFTLDSQSSSDVDFYTTTLEMARKNPGRAQEDLGYWSGFSRQASMIAPSLRYTLPLIDQDGTVYGVLGVGFAESTILSKLPVSDISSENACYILGRTTVEDTFDVLTYSGSAYGALLGSADTLHIREWEEEEGVYVFDTDTGADVCGSVQYIQMYGQSSLYAGEEWALISVAGRGSVLQPVLLLEQMLAFSAVLSLAVAAVVAVLSCLSIIRPIAGASRLMKTKRKHNEVVRFQPSNIYEIDEMTDAITQLQIDAQETSSRVSRMLSIADVGLGTFMYNRADDSVFVGQSLIKILELRLPREEDVVLGRQEFLDSIRSRKIRAIIAADLERNGEGAAEDDSKVYQFDRAGGGAMWLRLSYIYSADTTVGIAQDITDTVMEKKRIEYERDYDALTGLLNRHAYTRRLVELFQAKGKLGVAAFVMIDLDNLKYVNDTYGHDFGDDYINAAATALKKCQITSSVIARISGDEFAVCLPGFSSKEEARSAIADLRAGLLAGSCQLPDGTHFKIGASMGVSWYPDDSKSHETLMKYADFALYTTKRSTKGEMGEFDIDAYSTDSVLLTGVEELNRVIEKCSVKYAFQSIVSAKTGTVYGYEALMRVQSGIFQSPLELLRTAKTGAKLHEIERLTWTKALADFQAQMDAGRIEKNAHVFINSIANTRLEPEIETALVGEYPHLMDKIVMEILESEGSDEDYTTHKAELIRKWGGHLALDDFGTGYNSEYALLSIQPDLIKIDRSIISGCDKDASRRMIINNLVKLAREKGIAVLAEGVETEEEMVSVIACGVDLLQGYYLTYPLFEPKPIDPEITKTIQTLAHRGDSSEGSDL